LNNKRTVKQGEHVVKIWGKIKCALIAALFSALSANTPPVVAQEKPSSEKDLHAALSGGVPVRVIH
jgi:hypothetical protein